MGTNPGSTALAWPLRLVRFRLPREEIGSATSQPFNFGANYPVHFRSGLCSPCLRFAVVVTEHHARLGSWLLARRYQGRHLRRQDLMRLQGATPHRTGQVDFLHPALGQDICFCTRKVSPSVLSLPFRAVYPGVLPTEYSVANRQYHLLGGP